MSTNTLPRLDTDTIRQDMDIVAWIGEDVTLKKASGYYYGPCPFCEEGKDRFKVWPDTRLFNCRRCGRRGDIIEYQREKYGYDFVTAAKSLLAGDVPQLDEGARLAPDQGLQGAELAEYRRRLGELAERAALCLAEEEEAAGTALVTEAFGEALRNADNRIAHLTDRLVDAEKRAAAAETRADMLQGQIDELKASRSESVPQEGMRGEEADQEERRPWWVFWR